MMKTMSELRAMGISELEALQAKVDAAWDTAETEAELDKLIELDGNIQVALEEKYHGER